MTQSAILEATKRGDSDEVRRLVEADAALVSAKDEHEKTPLHYAAEKDDVATAAILLDAGADMEATTSWAATPLEWAVNLGSANVAALLLERGAKGMSLWVAAGLGREETVASYLADPSSIGGRPPRSGESSAHWPADSALLTNDVLGDALYVACRNGHTPVARMLLDAGGDVDAKGYFGGSGLHWAAHGGHADTVELLASRGANLSLRDAKFDATAAGWAIENEHRQIAARLLALGAKVYVWEASNYGDLATVRRMIDGDPGLVNAKGGWGTALHEAAFFGHDEIVELLLGRGADPTLETCRGETALQIARTRGHAALAARLEALADRQEEP